MKAHRSGSAICDPSTNSPIKLIFQWELTAGIGVSPATVRLGIRDDSVKGASVSGGASSTALGRPVSSGLSPETTKSSPVGGFKPESNAPVVSAAARS